jgi:hypothetical protein
MQFGQDYEKIFFKLTLTKPKYLDAVKIGFYKSEEIDLMSYLAKAFYGKFHEMPSKDQMKMLSQNSKKTKDKLTNEIINIVYDVLLCYINCYIILLHVSLHIECIILLLLIVI